MMILSEKTIKICKLTAPVLAKHGETVITKLYEKMYENYPESKILFGGAIEDQNKQFTTSIMGYADKINKIKTLNNSIEYTISKNLKKNTKHEHYPIVQISLLQAIKEVFGDAANDDVIEAWKEAYRFLDDIVVTRDDELYASA